MNRYPFLCSPVTIAGKRFRNRMLASPMGGVKTSPSGDIDLMAFAKVRAKAAGGCACVTVGETPVDYQYAVRDAHIPPVDYLDYDSSAMAAFRMYAEAFHKEGALALLQLFHCGASRLKVAENVDAYGPMRELTEDGVRVIGMDEAMMSEVAEHFAIAARFVQAAGFDGVSIHAGHGWLLSQFLSRRTNRRTDACGGSPESRARFPVRVVRHVREAVGEGFLIEVRLSGDEVVEDGIQLEDILAFCKGVEGAADLIHISAGLYRNPMFSRMVSSMFHPHGCNVELAAQVKTHINIPVAVVGGINAPEQAERWIADGKCDFVVLGRQMLADPAFANKTSRGEADDIARCVRCGRCFPGPFEFVVKHKLLLPGCTINPMLDRDLAQESIGKAKRTGRVLVAGGGCAGLQAALTAAGRGHDVTLIEQSAALGGTLRFTDQDCHKVDLRNYKDLLIRRIGRSSVRVRLNETVDAALITALAPDAIIAALGAEPIIPPIPGAEHAMTVLEAYDEGLTLSGKRLLFIGGGLAGCEAALHFLEQGCSVSVLEMAESCAPDAYPTHRDAVLERLTRSCTLKTGHRCVSIGPLGADAVDDNGIQVHFAADAVILAVGMRARKSAVESLRSAAGNIPFFTVGDCLKARKVYDAVYEACTAALSIEFA